MIWNLSEFIIPHWCCMVRTNNRLSRGCVHEHHQIHQDRSTQALLTFTLLKETGWLQERLMICWDVVNVPPIYKANCWKTLWHCSTQSTGNDKERQVVHRLSKWHLFKDGRCQRRTICHWFMIPTAPQTHVQEPSDPPRTLEECL